MSAVLRIDTTQDLDGNLLAEVRWLDNGTVEFHEAGKLVEARPQTADEAAMFAPAPLTAEERLAVLVDALAKVTNIAQVRAAAEKALEVEK